MQIWLAGQARRSLCRSEEQVHLQFLCVCVCALTRVYECVGLCVGGSNAPHYFVRAHLTKQRQLTSLVFCHIWYSGTSRRSGCKDPITPPLSLSLSLGCCVDGGSGGLGDGGGSFAPDRPCHSNAKPHLLQIHPSCSPSTTTTTLLLFRRISQLFLDGQAKPSKDLHWRYVIKTQPPHHAAINIKIKKKWYAWKMGSD